MRPTTTPPKRLPVSVRRPRSLRTLRIETNRGPARARNAGWRAAAGQFVAFLDDDCTPQPGWLARGCAELEQHPEAGVVQGATIAPPGFEAKNYGDHFVWRVITGQTPYFEACNIFYRRAALEATGGFDEDFGWWGEDTAAGWRVLEAGWGRVSRPMPSSSIRSNDEAGDGTWGSGCSTPTWSGSPPSTRAFAEKPSGAPGRTGARTWRS